MAHVGAEITSQRLETTDVFVGEGDGAVQVPALKAAGLARLRVEAKAGKSAAVVEENLIVAEPAHAAHLALNKSIYHTGEVLFFRALALDRFSLKPPEKELALRFALINADGQVVREMTSRTGAGGISGGEMNVSADLKSGAYSLRVSAADERESFSFVSFGTGADKRSFLASSVTATMPDLVTSISP